MLSALAKYIFGGVMGDAPETTPMQYETRELNDWLLVDMPDQAIDDEDMDSDNDDDDRDQDNVLTALRQLLAEDETQRNSRDFFISCESKNVCDKSYGKIRKDFHGKNHSASSKVQVHSGDKIQGNFVDNVEAISVEIGDNSNAKIQDNSSTVQENPKSQKSKSKKSKPKKSKKSKIQNKFDIKMRDISVAAKRICNDNDVQEISNDNTSQNFSDKIQPLLGEIPHSSRNKSKSTFVNEIEDNFVSVLKSSSDGMQDICEVLSENCNKEILENVDNKVQPTENKNRDSQEDDDGNDPDNVLTALRQLLAENESIKKSEEFFASKINSDCDNFHSKTQKDLHYPTSLKINSGDKIKRHYINSIETISVAIEDNSLDKMEKDSMKGQEKPESQKSKSKKSNPKKSKKNRIQNKFDVKKREVSVPVKENCSGDDVQEIICHNTAQDFGDKIQPVLGGISDSPVEENENRSVNEIENDSVAALKSSNNRIQNICEAFPENKISEYFDNDVQQDLHNDIQPTSFVFKNISDDKIQCNFVDKAESVTSLKCYNDTVNCDVQDFSDNVHRDSDEEVRNKSDDEVEIIINDKLQDIASEFKGCSKKSKSKKTRSKNFKKSKAQKFVKLYDISLLFEENYNDDLQEYSEGNDQQNFDEKIQSASYEIPDSSENEVHGRFSNKSDDTCISVSGNGDKVQNIFATEIEDILAVNQNCSNPTQENCTGEIYKEYDNNTQSMSSDVQQKSCDILEDNIISKVEAVPVAVVENSNETTDIIDSEMHDICVKVLENCNDELLENYNKAQMDFDDKILSIYSEVHKKSIGNKIDIKAICADVDPENISEKKIDSFDFQENCKDKVLDNFANLWDIYAKIQETSDDEGGEISNDEINENSIYELHEASDGELNDLSDDEMEESTDIKMNENSDAEMYDKQCDTILEFLFGEIEAKPYNAVFHLSPEEESEESDDEMFTDIESSVLFPSTKRRIMQRKSHFAQLRKGYRNFFGKISPNTPRVSKHHTGCVPYRAYEIAEYFSFEPGCFYASQSVHYPSSYALSVAELYANHVQYYQECQRYPNFMDLVRMYQERHQKRSVEENPSTPAPIDPSLLTNSAELLQNLINQKCSVLPTRTGVVLEHVKDLKPVQQAIQLENRKYLTRSQLNRQNRNYIYQSSVKTNRRRNLQRNHSGANNNRKCC